MFNLFKKKQQEKENEYINEVLAEVFDVAYRFFVHTDTEYTLKILSGIYKIKHGEEIDPLFKVGIDDVESNIFEIRLKTSFMEFSKHSLVSSNTQDDMSFIISKRGFKNILDIYM